MEKQNEPKWKKALDNILIYNLYILIIGSLFLGISFTFSVNGYFVLYNLFQKLWYPVFIPSLSLFFTAILIEAIFNKLSDRNKAKMDMFTSIFLVFYLITLFIGSISSLVYTIETNQKFLYFFFF